MKISLIGSGNVATHLAGALYDLKHQIVQVYSPNYQNAQQLAQQVKAQPISEWGELQPADLYLIAVKDSAIGEVAAQLASQNIDGIVVHTSGSTALDVINTSSKRYGVFYPLQTFSKAKAVDFAQVPLLLEGSSVEVLQQLDLVARQLSKRVYHYSTQQRRSLHLAAVIACNFSNYLYNVADDFLTQQGVEFDLLKPLIVETASKIQHHVPFEMQTGPAVRQDQGILDMHLHMLDNQPQLQQMYELLSEGIMQLHAKS
ncbi:MAG: DUF2520 domain-containing protein [Moraxellaceae bacterium]|nr:MAG: DUF2520 domain-containing protein [Moraxellaceae bacterium]